MKLYLLKRKPFTYTFDETAQIVVIAQDAREARKVASGKHGDEGAEVWLNSRKSSCQLLTATGKARVVIVDRLNG